MKRRHLVYVICISGLLILIAAAFLVPQLIFATQDNFRERNISLENRGNMDITKLNLTYEKSLSKRMTSFSQGIAQGKKYYVAATGYEVGEGMANEEDLYDIVQSITYQDIMSLLLDMGYVWYDSKGWDIESDMQAWKRYVIYDEDFQNGAALMAWYMEWQLERGDILRVLADTETGILYFAQIDCSKEMKKNIRIMVSDITLSSSNAYSIDCIINRDYETDKVNQQNEYGEEQLEGDSVSKVYNAEMSIISEMEQFVEEFEPEEYVLEIPLSYGGNVLNFRLEYLEQENRIEMGITEIGELIPEFADK